MVSFERALLENIDGQQATGSSIPSAAGHMDSVDQAEYLKWFIWQGKHIFAPILVQQNMLNSEQSSSSGIPMQSQASQQALPQSLSGGGLHGMTQSSFEMSSNVSNMGGVTRDLNISGQAVSHDVLLANAYKLKQLQARQKQQHQQQSHMMLQRQFMMKQQALLQQQPQPFMEQQQHHSQQLLDQLQQQQKLQLQHHRQQQQQELQHQQQQQDLQHRQQRQEFQQQQPELQHQQQQQSLEQQHLKQRMVQSQSQQALQQSEQFHKSESLSQQSQLSQSSSGLQSLSQNQLEQKQQNMLAEPSSGNVESLI
eukprot:Gb_34505 [translate_table: standard]